MRSAEENGRWKTESWFVSPWNYDDAVATGLNFAEKIRFHDVSLRDGEQQVGITLTKRDKIEIAKRLSEIGIDRIEAGMPAVSTEDEAAIKDIVQQGLRAEIYCFSRSILNDVRKASECGVSGVVIEIPASEHIIRYGYGWSLDKALKLSIEATQFAREAGLHTVFFPIDGTRADLGWFLDHIERIATEGHMDALVLADTFGVCSSHAIPFAVRKIRERIHKPLEIHFHNDFGQATANTLQALAAGASVAHTTVTGIGERSGNAPYEEVALALEALYGFETGIRTEAMYELSQFIRQVCGVTVAANRPVVGDGLFTFESGIIVGIWRKCRQEHLLEIIPFVPQLVGQEPIRVALGKKSGLESITDWLDKMDITISQEQKEALLAAVKERALQTKGLLSESEFKSLLVDQVLRGRSL